MKKIYKYDRKMKMKKLAKLFWTSICLFVILSGCATSISQSYDVLIIGNGLSGIVSAVELAKAGKKVVIIDESNILGGNRLDFMDGLLAYDTQLQKSLEASVTYEQLQQLFLAENQEKQHFFFEKLLDELPQNITWLESQGIHFDEAMSMYMGKHAILRKNKKHVGVYIIKILQEQLDKLGVKVYYESELNKSEKLTEEKYRMEVQTKTSLEIFHTRSVIIAEENNFSYTPLSTGQIIDEEGGINLTFPRPKETNGEKFMKDLSLDKKIGGEYFYYDTFSKDTSTPISPLLRQKGAVLINLEGNRFVDELAQTKTIIEQINNQTDRMAYIFFDETMLKENPFFAKYENNGAAIMAQSFLELSQKIGVPEENLRKTVIGYQKETKTNIGIFSGTELLREHDTFHVDTSNQKLYAIKVVPVMAVRDSYGYATDKFEMTSGGIPQKNLYIIGDGPIDTYPLFSISGYDLSVSVMSGRIASLQVNEALDRKE